MEQPYRYEGPAAFLRHTPLRWLSVLLLAALLLAACGDDDASTDEVSTDADGADDDAAEEAEDAGTQLPAACEPELPFTLEITGGDVLPNVGADGFEAVTVVAGQQPIVPDPERELTPEEIKELGETTPLVSYVIFLADFELTAEDVRFLGPTPPDDGTLFFISVVPPTEDGLDTGDVVDQGEPKFDSVTTLGTLGVQYQTGTVEDAPALALDGEGTGTAEVLYLDDERICLDVQFVGTIFGGEASGEPWSIDTVVGAELGERGNLPFT